MTSAMRQAGMPAASPFTFIRRFMEDMDRLFEGFGFGPSLIGSAGGGAAMATWVPPVEIEERDGQIVIRAEVPGLTKDQINVEFRNGQLVISGERRQEHEERREGFYRSERS
jgi:HSP20 family protein